jgi:hypothetical protein
VLALVFASTQIHLAECLFAPKLLSDAGSAMLLFSPGIRRVDVRRGGGAIWVKGAIACPLAGLAWPRVVDRLFGLEPCAPDCCLLFAPAWRSAMRH